MNLYLSAELKAALLDAARERGISQSALVSELILREIGGGASGGSAPAAPSKPRAKG